MNYVRLEKYNLKLLIDSGSNSNYIKKSFAYNNNFEIKQINVKVKSAHGETDLNEEIEFSVFSEFDINDKLNFKIWSFHPYYDGVIGMEGLRKLKAKLDAHNNLLIINNKEIKLSKADNYNTKRLELAPGEIKKMKIKIDKPDGEYFIENKDFSGIFKIKNGEFNVEFTNFENNWKEIILNNDYNDLEVEKFNEINFINDDKDISLKNLIRVNHLNNEEKDAILKVIYKNKDRIKLENQPLSCTDVVTHKIITDDELPVHCKLYRYPKIHKDEIEKQVQDLLNDQIIRPSFSPWASPVWIVPKKADASGKQKWRMVIDYRKLNEKTKDDRYPIPNIEDVLDQLGRAQYFTTLDLASGFHQIEVDEGSKEKTAFMVDGGHYEFNRMPFGLKNAPATFQRMINIVLNGLIGKGILVYMDDIIIYSVSLQEHVNLLNVVFDRLRKANLQIQADKSEFLKREAEFLGHVVTPDGIKPNVKKIEAIMKRSIPRNQKEIKSFLGATGYYRKFIKDYAKIAKHMTKYLKKGVKIDIEDPKYIESFETLRDSLKYEPVLIRPDFSQKFELTTDASNYAIGAVLSQNKKPMAYASRTLNEAETRYSTIEKELLAVVWATKYFRPYLYGQKFTLYTDHKPLEWLKSQKDPGSRLGRWAIKLQEYDFEIKYVKGKENYVADWLSRNKEEFNNNEDEDNRSMIVEIDKELTEADEDAQTIHTSHENPICMEGITDKILNIYNNQLIVHKGPTFMTTMQVWPKKKRMLLSMNDESTEEELVKLIKENFGIKTTNAIYFFDVSMEPKLTNILQTHFTNKLKVVKTTEIREDVPEQARQKEIIEKTHNEGHRGIEENLKKIKRFYYWPKMEQDLKEYVDKCENCLENKYDRHPMKIKFSGTRIGKSLFEIMYMDIFQYEKKYYLTLVDSLSKHLTAIPLENRTTVTIKKSLEDFIARFGLPCVMVADNAPEFKTELIREFMREHQCEIHYITPNNPNSNSPIERAHSTLIEILRGIKEGQKMNKALFIYNNTLHSTHDMTPMEIVRGYVKLEPEHRLIDNMIRDRNVIIEKAYARNKDKQEERLRRLNLNRFTVDTLPEEGYEKNVQIKSKNKPLYKFRTEIQNENLIKSPCFRKTDDDPEPGPSTTKQ